MFGVDLEAILALIILVSFGWLAFKGGKANPVSTGDLEKRVYKDIHEIKNEMQALYGRVDSSAKRSDIEALRTEIAQSAGERTRTASRELGKIQDQVTTVCQKVEGIEKSADRTAAGVDRLERYFLELGIKGRDK
jgi:polyhydroxyalkanoate synthesis regulator phasin